MPSRVRRIAFYDSGVGGLPYYSRTKTLMDQAEYYYLADSLNFPLGTKSRGEASASVQESVARLIRAADPDLVVVACNTATVVALGDLRAAWPGIDFVGTVPAIKPAAASTRSKAIAVLGSERLVRDPYTADLISKFASGIRVELRGMGEWVEFVERRWLDSRAEERQAIVSPMIDELISIGVDSIVLACTHFLFLEIEIAARAGTRAVVIDSSEGVAARAFQVLHGRIRESPSNDRPPGDRALPGFYVTAPHGRAERFAERFGLSYRGSLP